LLNQEIQPQGARREEEKDKKSGPFALCGDFFPNKYPKHKDFRVLSNTKQL
jgi:hypothetical protein